MASVDLVEGEANDEPCVRACLMMARAERPYGGRVPVVARTLVAVACHRACLPRDRSAHTATTWGQAEAGGAGRRARTHLPGTGLAKRKDGCGAPCEHVSEAPLRKSG